MMTKSKKIKPEIKKAEICNIGGLKYVKKISSTD